MQPIYNELIQMWHDKGLDIPIKEGMFWLDHGIIKAFDKNTEGDNKDRICYLYKIKVNDDLSMTFKKHKDFKKHQNKIFETWDETIKRNLNHLNQLESDSIKLLQQYGLNTDRKIIDTNSTGKDSMVKTHLAKKAGLKFDTYFNVTTLDVAESNRMAKELGFKFLYPQSKYGGFYQWRERENIIPSRLNRCCCKYFKEDATIFSFDSKEKLLFLFGMRNSESNARAKYQDVWCNTKWGKQRDWIGILPIRKWKDIDIWLYTLKENIPINKKYKMGYDRVGCGIACPNYTKTTWVLDQYWYPTMYNRWQRILAKDFIKNNKWLIMNCTLQEYLQKAWNGGVYRAEPTDAVINEFATYKNIPFDLAKKYFCHKCEECGKRIKNKDDIAMNLKFIGRDTQEFYCKKHLMEILDVDEEKYQQLIKSCKLQGCQLF